MSEALIDLAPPPAADRSPLLSEALAAAAVAPDPRAAAVAALRTALEDGRAEALSRLGALRDTGPRVARALAAVTDQIVCGALDFAAAHLNPEPADAAEHLTVVAVGGYGRGEMAPFSDVDLLFLTPKKQTSWAEATIEATLYLLWDLKLKVGQSVRSVGDCTRLAREDITIRTSLLEKRFLWGDAALAETLRETLRKDLFLSTAQEFVEAKLAERDGRHAKHGGSRYLVEPNVKESKGGLRDLQTLFWIAKYVYDVEEVGELIAKGVIKADEAEVFAAAESFLWTVRCHLHAIAGRPHEQLTFDFQVEVAERLGFEDRDGKRGVEVFMQRYFRHAKEVGELTRFFCAALEADQKKARPTIGAMIRAIAFKPEPAREDGFIIRDGRIDIQSDGYFDEDPVNIFRLFQEGLRTGALIHPNAHRILMRKLHLIDDELRKDETANEIFMWLLTESRDPERALRRMNETGVLGAFIPEFGRIVALMQFNMYHHYTVDEHTILAISSLQRLIDGELIEDLPVASDIMRKGVDLRVLYLALFFHDIGKGDPRAHEIVGAEVAAKVCPRLGLDEGQTEMVVWLVRHHLVMSDVAQKRDISDPATVRAFADQVRSVERLKLLLVLTALDIRAVGPGTWNNWKAQLLRALYADTLALLGVGNERLSREDRVADVKEQLRERLTTWKAEEVDGWLGRHYAPYWLGLDLDTLERLAEMGRSARPDQVNSRFDGDTGHDATRCCLYIADHPGLFSRMAGAFALGGASVKDARIFTSSDGMTSAVFWLQDGKGKPLEASRHERLKKAIHRSLRGEVVARDELKPRRNLKKRERPFDVPTTITFDNESSEIYTVIEVDTRDRVGLLYDLTRSLAAANVNISSAVITTYGEQVVDSFYVKDLFGFKISAAAKQKAIERRLRDAIRRAADEAETAS
ncbi:MAG: [protein-PII] uridylyltransferase [Pseudomonadota bacterium]